MTNKEWLSTLSAQDFYDEFKAAEDDARWTTNTALTMIEWLDEEWKDNKKNPIIGEEMTYNRTYRFHDWICPTCKAYLAPEANIEGIPKRCPQCGQPLTKTGLKEKRRRK